MAKPPPSDFQNLLHIKLFTRTRHPQRNQVIVQATGKKHCTEICASNLDKRSICPAVHNKQIERKINHIHIYICIHFYTTISDYKEQRIMHKDETRWNIPFNQSKLSPTYPEAARPLSPALPSHTDHQLSQTLTAFIKVLSNAEHYPLSLNHK